MRFIKKFFSKNLNKAFVRSFEKGFYQKALHYAQKGADPNAKNFEGNTFLHYYVAAYVHLPARELKVFKLPPEPDENILTQMKELGADIEAELTTASSLTHLAEKGKAVVGKFSHTNFERIDMILQELKEKGFNVDKTPKPKEITSLAVIEPVVDIQAIKKRQISSQNPKVLLHFQKERI